MDSIRFLLEAEDGCIDNEIIEAKHILDKLNLPYELSDTSVRDDIKDIQDYIPIGCIQFVEEHLKTYHNVPFMCPIEVPKFLRKPLYLQRQYDVKQVKDLPKEGVYFLKGAERLKSFSYCGLIEHVHELMAPDEWCVISNIIDRDLITSEHRVFVHNGEIKAIKQYTGSKVTPSEAIINIIKYNMNSHFPIKTYSFDIGLMEDIYFPKVFLIEVHLVASIGTYGYTGEEIIDMYTQTYNFLKNDQHKEIIKNRTLIW